MRETFSRIDTVRAGCARVCVCVFGEGDGGGGERERGRAPVPLDKRYSTRGSATVTSDTSREQCTAVASLGPPNIPSNYWRLTLDT